MHRLIAPRFIDPRWRNIGQQEATVIDNQSVQSLDQIFHLADPSEIVLSPSQKVFVRLSRYFYLETEEEQKEKQHQAEERRQREKEEYRILRNKQREEAEAFNAQLHIPVKWVSGYKSVLSGLTENSWGDGRNKATVNHILIQEDLEDGKIHRKEGDFLCSSSKNQNGKLWTVGSSKTPISLAYDGEGNEYQTRITCQSCLKIASKWQHD